MSAAAVVAQMAEMGAGAVAIAAVKVTPWIALAVGVAMLAGRWVLGRRSRITHLVILPPAEDGDDLGDDAIEMVHGWDAELERLTRDGENHG